MQSGIHASRVRRHLEWLAPVLALEEQQIVNTTVRFIQYLEELRGQPLGGVNVEKLYTYRVPAIDPDGCSRLDGSLAAEPYDLRKVMGLQSGNGLLSKPQTRQLFLLDRLVERVTEETSVHWLGFYQRRTVGPDTEALVKLAYRGTESRAEFPLTREFARKSNNTTVGLTGKGIIINDIERYLWEQGGPYYQCDSKVHSEACLPIFSGDGEEVIGIVDAESYERNKFSVRELTTLVATAIVLEDLIVPV